MKIIIADDSDLIRERIRKILEADDKIEIVAEVNNGPDALKELEIKKPDVIVLDIHMHEMSGITVLEKIREMKIPCKVCMLTNYPYKQYREKCLKSGADYFFDKNEEFQLFVDKMKDMVNTS
jgi:DNA-binding NarL/FixJ family response regulator